MWQRNYAVFLILLFCYSLAQAQTIPAVNGTTMTISATGETKRANDQAYLYFSSEEENQSETVAASKVNQKMTEAAALIKRLDPKAILQTSGYYTYPVYPAVELNDTRAKRSQATRPVRWRVSQSLHVTTTSLSTLSKTVAAMQGVVSLTGISFGLSDEANKQLDQEKIAMAYRQLSERIASIAQIIGVDKSRAVIEKIDFATDSESGFMPRMMSAPMLADKPNNVVEPSFEPGEATVKIRIIGTVVFK